MKKQYTRLRKRKRDGFFQLCIIVLIGIIGVTVSVEAIEIHQLKQEIQIIKQWLEE